MVWFLFSTFVILLLTWWDYMRRKYANNIPGPKYLPFLGNAHNFHVLGIKCIKDFENGLKKYGSTFRIWIGPQLYVFVSDLSDVQMVLSSPTLIKKGVSYKLLDKWFGSGLLVSTGELWHRRRKAITPTFHFQILGNFIPIFNKCGDTFVECLNKYSNGLEFNIFPLASNCALDSISESAMGVPLNSQLNPLSQYVETIINMTKLLAEKLSSPWLAMEPLYTITGRRKEESKYLYCLDSFTTKLIKEKEKSVKEEISDLDENNTGIKEKTAFLELLLKLKRENNLAFQTEKDVRDEVRTFMFEGHDTTTSLLSFTLWCLGRHPEIQEKVYDEISSFSINTEVTYQNLNEMKYLDRVIKETLRLYPPVPGISRLIEDDIVLPSGIRLTKGTEILLSSYFIHRNPESFPDPEKFDPDRFLSENVQKRHPYAYVPFSAGPRNCIGQKFALLEVKTVISKIVFNYKILSEDDLILDPELILRSVDGPKISITPRKRN